MVNMRMKPDIGAKKANVTGGRTSAMAGTVFSPTDGSHNSDIMNMFCPITEIAA